MSDTLEQWVAKGLEQQQEIEALRTQLAACQRENEELRGKLNAADTYFPEAALAKVNAEEELAELRRCYVEVMEEVGLSPDALPEEVRPIAQMREALEQLTIIVCSLEDRPDEEVVSMGIWDQLTHELAGQVFTLPEFHAKVKFDLKWLRAARALIGKGEGQ